MLQKRLCSALRKLEKGPGMVSLHGPFACFYRVRKLFPEPLEGSFPLVPIFSFLLPLRTVRVSPAVVRAAPPASLWCVKPRQGGRSCLWPFSFFPLPNRFLSFCGADFRDWRVFHQPLFPTTGFLKTTGYYRESPETLGNLRDCGESASPFMRKGVTVYA